jgi:hypothetical protein
MNVTKGEFSICIEKKEAASWNLIPGRPLCPRHGSPFPQYDIQGKAGIENVGQEWTHPGAPHEGVRLRDWVVLRSSTVERICQGKDEVGLRHSQTRQPYVQGLYSCLRSVHSSSPAHQEVPRE